MVMGVPLNLGNRAPLAAFFTQLPVGVPEKTPFTLAPFTRPLRPMVIWTLARPGTLNRS